MSRPDAAGSISSAGSTGSMNPLDLLVVGAGPTGLSTAAAALAAGLSVLTVDRGAITDSIQRFPTDVVFFSTRERLAIAGVPFAIPEEKPNRRQVLAYYRAVAQSLGIPLALREDVVAIAREGATFAVRSRRRGVEILRRARAVALAIGYFDTPRRLGVPGEEPPRVQHRYVEPYGHYGERILVVGGGNSAAEAALELWRAGARVLLVHRGAALKPTVKYWLRPDLENRVAEGAIEVRYVTRVTAFEDGFVRLAGPGGEERVEVDATYVLAGYAPDFSLARAAGVDFDAATGVPCGDPASCESNVPGLYVAGTLQAGFATHSIFIENSREHGPRLVAHLAARLARSEMPEPSGHPARATLA